MDFTPGVLSLTGKGGRVTERDPRQAARNFCRALFAVQMAADLLENLARSRARKFIAPRCRPIGRETRTLAGEVGEICR